ncbi:ABC transporter ATP-binding protein [Nocardioides sp. AN3]
MPTAHRAHAAALAVAVAEPAPAVEVRGVRHEFGSQIALHELDLQVGRGQFYTLLGPSGSGKTTLLRIIAGLLMPSAGSVHIAGRDVTQIDVQHRNIGFVFQNYALFPHLTVQENIEFALKLRGDGRAQRSRQTAEMVGLVHLGGLESRYPGELSGGQQQRVAIARALAFEPEVLLLDEPLGALDRRLRQLLGAELRRIQQDTGITAIYVTHDQEEAFILSDTVVVMSDGGIRQCGSPAEVYTAPKDHFVATFLGDTNILTGQVMSSHGSASMLDVDGIEVRCSGVAPAPVGSTAMCSIRPEDVEIVDGHAPERADRCRFGPMDVTRRLFLGGRYRLTLRREDARLDAEVAARGRVPDVGERVEVGWRSGIPVVLADTQERG